MSRCVLCCTCAIHCPPSGRPAMDNDAISAAVILENVNDAVIAIDPDEHIVV